MIHIIAKIPLELVEGGFFVVAKGSRAIMRKKHICSNANMEKEYWPRPLRELEDNDWH